MRAKVTEVNGRLDFIEDDNVLRLPCTTTLSELKKMWEDEKIIKECKEEYPNNFELQLVSMSAIKNSPRKFTIEQVISVCNETERMRGLRDSEIVDYLTKLPPNGIEVEIEGNKIVKVYV